MGCFDFDTEEFILHPNFMKVNAQRILEFNANTSYPIVSALRVQKYEKKGYKIAKTEFLKIIFACMKLNITTYEELKEHCGGMYGINYDKIFDDSKEFSLDEVIKQLSDLHLNKDYFKGPVPIHFDDVDDIVDNVLNLPRKYFILNNTNYKINQNGTVKTVSKIPENSEIIVASDYFKSKRIYKFVNKHDDGYFSFYDKDFEYKIGETAIAKGRTGVLYCGFIDSIKYFTYANNDNSVLIELEIEDCNDIKTIGDSKVEIKKAKMLREVPKEEYKKYLEDDEDDEIC